MKKVLVVTSLFVCIFFILVLYFGQEGKKNNIVIKNCFGYKYNYQDIFLDKRNSLEDYYSYREFHYGKQSIQNPDIEDIIIYRHIGYVFRNSKYGKEIIEDFLNSLKEIQIINNDNRLTLRQRFIELPKVKEYNFKDTDYQNDTYLVENNINFLLFDLIKEERKYHMYAYSLPEMTSDQVAKIESGKLLVNMAENNPELSQEIGDKLKEIIMSSSHDTVRGIAMYYLSEIEKVSGLSWNIGDSFPEILENHNEMLYFDYYLNKAQK